MLVTLFLDLFWRSILFVEAHFCEVGISNYILILQSGFLKKARLSM